ncbi:MAG: delta-60 repeat domain-containing protein, partial [Bacteroidetes bacterium]|nr:delta-60 repeat domain-containing protein [Bacteroidota bacterium]
MKYPSIILYIVFSFFVSNNFAQDGQLDTSFGDNGTVLTDFFGLYDLGFAIALQDDGSIVAAGISEIQSNDFVPALARYLPDGSLDISFGVDGIVLTDYNTSGVDGYFDLAIQIDQKIVAGGHFGNANYKDLMIARYLPDGMLDPAFGNAGIVITDIADNRFQAMTIQNDQKILLAGTSKPQNQRVVLLIRYLPDGNLDLSFGDNGVVTTNAITNLIDAAHI